MLPDLEVYRRELVAEGAPVPLPLVPFRQDGLLAELPKATGGRQGWPWTVQTPPPLDVDKFSVISIVMPSFQQAEFIEEAIRSILLQNYPKLELIVMDGGSKDGAAELLERYRPWISHVRLAPDRGQSHAINLGFSLAAPNGLRGWLNSDDFYLPGSLECVGVRWLTTHADFLYGDGLTLDQETQVLHFDAAGYAHPYFRRYAGNIYSHAAFWHSSIHEPVRETLHCAMDYELWIRLLQASCRRRYIPKALGTVRAHRESKSCSPVMKARWDQDQILNGQTHPGIYGPDPVRSRAHRWIGRIVRLVRGLGRANQLDQIVEACGWHPSGLQNRVDEN